MNLNTHPVPEHLAKRITEKGGLAPNGQPLFRVIWGGDRMTVIGGELKKFDDSGNVIGTFVGEMVVSKYGHFDERWILEMWTPPENYGDSLRWELDTVVYIGGKKIYQLGPYPANGEYELVKPIETPDGRYVPLTSTVCDAIAAVASMNRHLPNEIRMAYHRDQEKKREEASAQWRADKIREIACAYSGTPHVFLPKNITQKGDVSL